MLDFLFKPDSGQLKGFKVTDIERCRKFGIAANSLGMLRAKSAAKFKVYAPPVDGLPRTIIVAFFCLLLLYCCRICFTFFPIYFNTQIENARLYLAKDGTEILDEEYFSTIEPQTVIVIAGQNDTVKTGIKICF